MVFLIVLLASLLIAFALRNKLEYAVVAVIAARYFIPSSASVDFVPFLDPAVYLLAAVYLVQLIWNFNQTVRAFYFSRIETFVVLALGLLAVANIFGQGVAPLSTVSDFLRVYLAPFLLYVLVRRLCIQGDKKALVVVYSYLGFAVIQAVMAIIQDQQGALVVWESAFRRLWAGVDGAFGRSQGFVEFGLGLGTSMIPAIAFCAWLRSAILKFALSLLFLYAMVLSSSRAALIVGIVLVVVITFIAAGSLLRNVLTLGAMAATAVIFVSAGGAEKLIAKIADDNASTAKRLEAYSWFVENVNSFLLFGYQGNRDFRGSRTLSSSLENAFFMAGANYGAIFALLLVGLLLFIALRAFAYGKLAVVAGIALLGLLAVESTNSGFASLSFSGYALWMLAGICSYGAWRKLPWPVVESGAPLAAPEPAGMQSQLPASRKEAPYRRYLTEP
ncbi:MAG: hypothetical protein L0G87_07965 [Renibacterium salmoninarum]|nr:hypothetical protein [Renibacterium salmoninarum]